jgi:acylphosphatase
MNNIRVRLKIQGRVQGVWFRDSTRSQAIGLGLCGWVKNCPDGSVEVLAEGEEDKIRALIRYCGKGPPHARVDHLQEIREEWSGEFDSFDIVF